MSFEFVYNDDTSSSSSSGSPERNPGPSEPRRLAEASGIDGSARNRPGYTPPAPRPPFRPEFGPVARPASRLVFQQRAVGANNTRGCRFSSVLNSHGMVGCECTIINDIERCLTCMSRDYLIQGWSLYELLDGLNHPRNPRANVSPDAPNSSIVKRNADSEQHVAPADPDQDRESSVIDRIGEAARMVEEDSNLFFDESEKKQALRDLAVLNKRFRRSLCYKISVYILVAVMFVGFCSWIVAHILIAATKK